MADNHERDYLEPETGMDDQDRYWEDEESDYEDDLLDLDPEELAEQDVSDGRAYLMDAASLLDSLMLASGADDVTDDMADYTDDPDVLQDFIDRQQLTAGSEELYTDLAEHTALSPEISGGDLDARWQAADQSGEEAVGGTVMTPDQDVVDELGDAVGINYSDDEPLHTYDKLASRDENRWELDPQSAQDDEAGNPEVQDEDAQTSRPRRRKGRR